MKRSIYIGWDRREQDAYAVARLSLLRHLSKPIPVHALVLEDVQAKGLYTRPTERCDGRLIDTLSIREDYDGSCSTEHAIARFLVPLLAGSGWALSMDGDMLVRSDISRMFDGLKERFAVYCVKHNYVPTSTVKMDGQIQTKYVCKNWSSFMVFNCDHPANREGLIAENIVNRLPGRDLHRFCWLDDDEIGELPASWNWIAGHNHPGIDPDVVHFSEGIPSMAGYENVPYADEWRAELRMLAA